MIDGCLLEAITFVIMNFATLLVVLLVIGYATPSTSISLTVAGIFHLSLFAYWSAACAASKAFTAPPPYLISFLSECVHGLTSIRAYDLHAWAIAKDLANIDACSRHQLHLPRQPKAHGTHFHSGRLGALHGDNFVVLQKYHYVTHNPEKNNISLMMMSIINAMSLSVLLGMVT